MNLKTYSGGNLFTDTTTIPEAGVSYFLKFTEDKSIQLIGKNNGKSDTIPGTYNITDSIMVWNLIHPINGPFTREFENLTFDNTNLAFTLYDPNKTDRNRVEITYTYKRN